jgi:hypothetical protein
MLWLTSSVLYDLIGMNERTEVIDEDLTKSSGTGNTLPLLSKILSME